MKKRLEKKKAISYLFVCITVILMLLIATINTVLQRNKIMNLENSYGMAKAYAEVTEAEKKTQSPNVEFSAFFQRDIDNDGEAERTYRS